MGKPAQANPSSWITCSMCGHRFDPAAHIACAGCPIQKNCQLICCPRCGFETVDPDRSGLAQLAKRLLPLRQNAGREGQSAELRRSTR